jgi:hypothetical protein
MKNLILASVLIQLFLLPSCSNKIPDNFDYGSVSGTTYTNKFFNNELKIPKGWHVASKEQNEAMQKQGQELITKDNQSLKKMIKASEISTATLLTCFKYREDEFMDFNPSVMVIVENIQATPGVRSGQDYLKNAHKFLKQLSINYTDIDTEYKKETFGAKEFYRMRTTVELPESKIYQTYYSGIINNFSFNFICTYQSREDQKEMEKMLKSLKFN